MNPFSNVNGTMEPCEIWTRRTDERQNWYHKSIEYPQPTLLHRQIDSPSIVQQITVHGIKEAWLIKNKPIKFLWIIILLGCLCGVTYEIYQVVVYYRSNPSATQVKWVVNNTYDYPPMVFCPKTVLNLEKINKLNMSTAALTYVVSLFQLVYPSNVPEDFQFEKARVEVRSLMQKYKFNTYLDLFAAIAYDGKEVLHVIGVPTVKMDVYIPRTWLCYKLHLPRLESSNLKTTSSLRFIHVPSPNVTEYDLKHEAAILVRDTTGTKTNMVILLKNAQYDIDFQVQVHKRLSRPGMECFSPKDISEDYYVDDCRWACLEREKYYSGCSTCLPFDLINASDNHILPCSSIKLKDPVVNERKSCTEVETINRSKACLSKCLPVCEQWIYTHSTLIFDDYTSSVYIQFFYNPSNGILTYEEVPTYNVDTFISNIGGQLGLWLGASVVSVFQIFYYGCLAAFRQRKRITTRI